MNWAKIVVYGMVLVVKTPVLLVVFLNGRRVGARAFEQELIRAGMDPEQATDLKETYKRMFLPKWRALFRRVKGIAGPGKTGALESGDFEGNNGRPVLPLNK